MSSWAWKKCGKCGTDTHKGYKCNCGGDPWEVAKEAEARIKQLEQKKQQKQDELRQCQEHLNKQIESIEKEIEEYKQKL